MTEPLTYRPYRPEDIPALLRLWEEEAGWGKLSEETWRQWFIDGPLGPALVVVAARPDDEVVAQQIYSPVQAVILARTVKALHLSAPIVREDFREGLSYHPDHIVIRLLECAIREAAAQGFALIYAQPKHAWLRFTRTVPYFSDAEYPCVKRALLPVEHPGDSLVAGRALTFTPDYEDLWNQARENFPIACGITRTPAILNYRYGGRLVVEVRGRNDGRLQGYAAFRRETGLLDDLLADRPEQLMPVLATALDLLASQPDLSREFGLTAVRAMATPLLREGLQLLGFEPVHFTFAFICGRVDPSLPPEAADPRFWYLTPGD